MVDISQLNWPQNVAEAKAQQQQLRHQVSLQDSFNVSDLTYIAGTDVAYKDNDAITRAVITVFSFPDLQVVESAIVEQDTRFPYVPGYLSYRELPALVDAWQQLKIKPQLFLCDGQGIAHPRRFGLAAHLGVVLGYPAIGVAKKIYAAKAEIPAPEKGAVEPMFDGDEQLGWVLRSRTNVKPIYVSPGHQISLETSLQVVEQCCQKYRLPEPTRIADKLSKQASS